MVTLASGGNWSQIAAIAGVFEGFWDSHWVTMALAQ
jgi:hypothetical protein